MRISRKCYNSKFFHVMIQGLNKEKIFIEKFMKEKLLKYMQESSKNNNVSIIAYCIMDNHTHFLLYTEESSFLSKMMLSLNTKYALFYNKSLDRCGFVFRDRYRCESIHDISYLKNCIRYIHNNPVKANICKSPKDYLFSSYKDYLPTSNSPTVNIDILQKFLGTDINFILKSNNPNIDDYENFIDVENEFGNQNKIPPEKLIQDYCLEHDIYIPFLKNDHLKELILLLVNKYGMTKPQIGKLLKLSKSRIYRILNK